MTEDEGAEIVSIDQLRQDRAAYQKRQTERRKRKLLRDQAGAKATESVPYPGGIDDLKIE